MCVYVSECACVCFHVCVCVRERESVFERGSVEGAALQHWCACVCVCVCVCVCERERERNSLCLSAGVSRAPLLNTGVRVRSN